MLANSWSCSWCGHPAGRADASLLTVENSRHASTVVLSCGYLGKGLDSTNVAAP